MRDPMGVEWVTIGEAARRVRVREDVIRQWKHRGTIRAHRVGSRVFVAMQDVAAREVRWRRQLRDSGS